MRTTQDAPKTRPMTIRLDEPPDALLPGAPDLLERLSEPGVCDVRDRLRANGASDELTTSVVRAILKRGVKGAWAIDAAAQVLGRSFHAMPSPKLRRGSGTLHSLVFVGPNGGGKTSTLAKLARRMGEVGRRVLTASLDSVGTGALERIGGLEADVDRTELPIVQIREASDLAPALHRSKGTEICLIDTPGVSVRDTEALDTLARELERLADFGPVQTLLVLPASSSRAALRLARRALARMQPAGCVLTKLDETDQPGEALEELARANLPVAFLCDGADVRGHLVRPTPERFADLFLRGRYR